MSEYLIFLSGVPGISPIWEKSVGGNGSDLVKISRSKDFRNLPLECVCTQAGLYKDLKSRTLDICRKSSYLKIAWLFYIVWHSIMLWIHCSFKLTVLCWTHTHTGLHYVLQMLSIETHKSASGCFLMARLLCLDSKIWLKGVSVHRKCVISYGYVVSFYNHFVPEWQ